MVARRKRKPPTPKKAVRRKAPARKAAPPKGVLFCHSCEDDLPVRRIATFLVQNGIPLELAGDGGEHLRPPARGTDLFKGCGRILIFWSRSANLSETVKHTVEKARVSGLPHGTVILEDADGFMVSSKVPAYLRVEEGPDLVTGWLLEEWGELLRLTKDFATGDIRNAKTSGQPL